MWSIMMATAKARILTRCEVKRSGGATDMSKMSKTYTYEEVKNVTSPTIIADLELLRKQ